VRAMRREFVLVGAALLLCGCGGYLDQHPANVRPESEAVAAVFASQRPVASAQSGPVTPSPGAATAPGIAETVLPPAVPAAPQRAVAPIRNTPSEPPSGVTQTLPRKSAAAVAVSPGSTARPAPAIPPVPEAVPFTPAETPAAAAAESEPAPTTAARPAPPAVAMAPVSDTPPVPVASPPPPAPPITPSPAAPDAHCKAVARQRADDAAASGLDRETQEIVRHGTYANCLAWDAAHPRAP
jgi:hypothetical protein